MKISLLSVRTGAARHGATLFTAALLGFAAVAAAEPPPVSSPALQAPATELAEVQVTGRKEATPVREGSAESGYRAESATAGALGTLSLMDTPFAIGVTPSDFIENIQAGSATEALRYNPAVNPEMGSNRTGDYLSVRGFINSNNQALDGMRQDMGNGAFLEDKERIEVLTGADSFLYGISSPAGMVNYVLKRPTVAPMLMVTLGDYGGGQAYAHVDAGGPIDKGGRFGYRLNLLGVDKGDTGVDHETHRRYLLSGALDWHLTPSTLWAFDLSHYHRELENMQAFFKIGTVTRVPDAPDASKNYAAPYNGSENSSTTVGTKLVSELGDHVSLRSAFRYTSSISNGFRSMRNVWTDNAGDYNQQMMYYNGQTEQATTQGNLFVDGTFRTGFVGHRITVGYGIDYLEFSSTSPGTSTFNFPAATLFNLNDPGYSPDPQVAISKGTPYRTTEETTRQSVTFADRLTLGDSWSLLAGGAYAAVEDRNFSPTSGLLATNYDRGAFTPSVALTYRPLPALTAYLSYNESLNMGPIAPSTAANANQALKPFLSSQEEAGVKTLLGGLGMNAAVFRIEQANAYTDPVTGVYSEDGREVHIGGEFSFSGKLTDALTLLGGFSMLRATMDKTSTPSLQGKTPQAVPASLARLYGEYALPAVAGLVLSGGVSYTGREWVNDTNTLSIPYVITGDVGARYGFTLWGKPTTLRLNVNNVSDENYWTTKGGGMLYLGSPRTVAVSATTEF